MIEFASTGKKFSAWTHFPFVDLDPELLAEKTVAWGDELNLDIIKTMPNGFYMVEDFGYPINYGSIGNGGVACIDHKPIQCLQTLSQFKMPLTLGRAVKREIISLKKIRQRTHKPILFTTYTPLTLLFKLVSINLLTLDVIEIIEKNQMLQQLSQFVGCINKMALEAGADGLFIASQVTPQNLHERDLYIQHLIKYDTMVACDLNPRLGNVFHIHGRLVYPELYYAHNFVQALSWHVQESEVTIQQIVEQSNKLVFGGLNREYIVQGKLSDLMQEISHYQQFLPRIIFAPNCTIRHPISMQFLKQLRHLL